MALLETIQQDGNLSKEQKAYLSELINSKKYGLVWETKPEEVHEELRTHIPFLKEDKGKRILNSPSAPNHLIVEGDNYQVLTDLCYIYDGRVDVIYIDPPYNTGNKDFVYNDSFVDREDGFRHSMWLSFMEKRLRLAKRLLSDKGVIFISIDDNEQAQLKLLCDEVLSIDFVAQIPWRKRTAKADVPHSLSQDFEWILCYANERFRAGISLDNRRYYESDDFPGRPWRIHDLTKQTTAEERPNSNFPIVNPKNGKVYPANPKRTWAITSETFEKYYKEKRIVFPEDYSFLKISRPVLRYFKEDDDKKAGEYAGISTVSTLLPKEVGMTQDGTKDIGSLFESKVFGFPKPLSLIKYIINIASPLSNTPVTILDFFAGSGTTLHATMQLNKEDGGKRKCILVTNNENGICENVTYVRNKKVIEGYTTPKGQEVEGLKDNNLRYYKVELMERERSFACRNKLQRKGVDMLCIKENIYAEQSTFGKLQAQNDKLRYFAEGGREMLVVLDYEWIVRIVGELKGMETTKKIKVYVSCPMDYPFTEEFEEVAEKVELIPFPAQFLNVYNKVTPKMPDKELDDYDNRELTEEERRETAEDYLPSETTDEGKEEAQW